MVRIVIVPGNGCFPVRDSNWYEYAERKLLQSDIFDEVILTDMPDPVEARESIWLPFLLNSCKVDDQTIVIGHSSGAGIRCTYYAEPLTLRIYGILL